MDGAQSMCDSSFAALFYTYWNKYGTHNLIGFKTYYFISPSSQTDCEFMSGCHPFTKFMYCKVEFIDSIVRASTQFAIFLLDKCPPFQASTPAYALHYFMCLVNL